MNLEALIMLILVFGKTNKAASRPSAADPLSLLLVKSCGLVFP